MRKTAYIISVTVISLGILLLGCGRSADKGEDNRLLAKINDYELTVADFKDEAGLFFSHERHIPVSFKAKTELLDDMITKKIMLQEAQKRNFDKDRAFMKEIERYWEQALLKLLVKNKTEELSRTVTVKDSEVKAEYAALSKEEAMPPLQEVFAELKEDIRQRKIREAFDAWMKVLRERSSVDINEAVLREIRID